MCVCEWGELKNDRVKKSKFTMGGGSERSHRKRERRKSVRGRERDGERARAFVVTSISLWGIPGFMLMRSS